MICGDTMYGVLSDTAWIYKIDPVIFISWLNLTFSSTSKDLQGTLHMLEINYERMHVAKRYFNYELLCIWSINGVSMVLQHVCAHSLKSGYLPPTPNILPCSKMQNNGPLINMWWCRCVNVTLSVLLSHIHCDYIN